MSDRIGHAATAGYVLIVLDESESESRLEVATLRVFHTVLEAQEEALWRRRRESPQVFALVPVELLDGAK